MTNEKKRSRQGTKRSVSGLPITIDSNNDEINPYTGNLADDYQFLEPYQICSHAIGLLFTLTTKRLTSISFSTLFQRSQKRSWLDIFICERRGLKPNVNSIEKCFILNRLIAAYITNPAEFVEKTMKLYKEIEARMTCIELRFPTIDSLCETIESYRNLHYQQRLFYMDDVEMKQSETFLSLQYATTKWCSKLMNSPNKTERDQLNKLLKHSFIIAVQPSIPECVAGIKYEKLGNTYVGRLNSRIVCLLDVDEIHAHFTFSDISVRLFSLHRQLDEEGEIQNSIQWKKRSIIDEKGSIRLVYYADIHSITLNKSDIRSTRPLYNSKLCQLQFQFKIQMKNSDVDEEEIIIVSQPFGLCSHAQYFPVYVSKVLIYEIERITQYTDILIKPDIITKFLCRYHTRITGVQFKTYTIQMIFREIQAVYEQKNTCVKSNSTDIYEEILSKLISQIEFFFDHPYLSMMYADSLFLGICDSKIDNIINGTSEQPVILLRFDPITEHSSCQQASVRYIVHNGQLIKATFHTKAFVDEMCHVICESVCERAKTSRILTHTTDRTFHDFTLYFDNELFRLSTLAPSSKEVYQPLIPILWSTMRSMSEQQSEQISTQTSSSSDTDPTTSSISSETNPSTILNEKFIHYLAKKVPEMLVKLQMPLLYPIVSSISADDIHDQNHSIISNLIHDYIQTTIHDQYSTQNDTNTLSLPQISQVHK